MRHTEEDWEKTSLRERAEIAAEINEIMKQEWWQWCEEHEQEKLPAKIVVKKTKKKVT